MHGWLLDGLGETWQFMSKTILDLTTDMAHGNETDWWIQCLMAFAYLYSLDTPRLLLFFTMPQGNPVRNEIELKAAATKTPQSSTLLIA